MRTVVTGARGMLGSDICDVVSEHSEIAPFDLDDFDVANLRLSRARISRANPDVIIHCAAYTDVDGAEREPEEAFRVNTRGAKNIALVSHELSVPMVYISTDYVFNGAKGSPYLESDEPSPVNVYGKSKLDGEKWIRKLLHRFFIVRTSWLFGSKGRSFVHKILQASRKLDSPRPHRIPVVADQFGSPTYTVDLAHSIALLIQRDFYGIYHITNSGHCSWFQFARKVFDCLEIEAELVPVDSNFFRQTARRPGFSVLDNSLWEKESGVKLPHWEDALERFLSTFSR